MDGREKCYFCSRLIKIMITKNMLLKMKKLMMTLTAVLAAALTTQAQVKPQVLGDRHAMIRVEQGKKYVLLPVLTS